MAPHLSIIVVRFITGLLISVSGFVVANSENTNRTLFVFGMIGVVSGYIAAFLDRSVGQKNADKESTTADDENLLNDFMEASGFDRKNAEFVLKTNRAFAEETIKRWKP
jgi:hypothetical protein